jgi:hypothetical protein
MNKMIIVIKNRFTRSDLQINEDCYLSYEKYTTYSKINSHSAKNHYLAKDIGFSRCKQDDYEDKIEWVVIIFSLFFVFRSSENISFKPGR